jgi:hypothetical protein
VGKGVHDTVAEASPGTAVTPDGGAGALAAPPVANSVTVPSFSLATHTCVPSDETPCGAAPTGIGLPITSPVVASISDTEFEASFVTQT